MASKIKVDQIEGSTASTVSLPSGQTLDLSSGSITLPDSAVDLSTAKVTGTIPVSKGGTGLTSLGSAGQSLKVNSGGTALEFGTVGGTNTPSWFAYLNSTTDVTANSFVTVPFGHELFDTDNAFNTSNYRFTVPSGKAGKYFVQFSVNIGGVGDNQTERRYTKLMKNGSNFVYGLNQDLTSDADAINHDTSDSSAIVDLAVGDYLTVEAYHQTGYSTGRFMGGSNHVTRFTGFKLL